MSISHFWIRQKGNKRRRRSRKKAQGRSKFLNIHKIMQFHKINGASWFFGSKQKIDWRRLVASCTERTACRSGHAYINCDEQFSPKNISVGRCPFIIRLTTARLGQKFQTEEMLRGPLTAGVFKKPVATFCWTLLSTDTSIVQPYKTFEQRGFKSSLTAWILKKAVATLCWTFCSKRYKHRTACGKSWWDCSIFS